MPKTNVTIELTLACNSELAFDIVDAVLDAGTLQDALVEYADNAGRGPLIVLRAYTGNVATVDEAPKKARKSTRRKGA
jgi:hypothetical protein